MGHVVGRGASHLGRAACAHTDLCDVHRREDIGGEERRGRVIEAQEHDAVGRGALSRRTLRSSRRSRGHDGRAEPCIWEDPRVILPGMARQHAHVGPERACTQCRPQVRRSLNGSIGTRTLNGIIGTEPTSYAVRRCGGEGLSQRALTATQGTEAPSHVRAGRTRGEVPVNHRGGMHARIGRHSIARPVGCLFVCSLWFVCLFVPFARCRNLPQRGGRLHAAFLDVAMLRCE